MRRFGRFFCDSVASKTATAPQNHALVDSFGRFHSYLRISLTEKCNLRCTYCMPEDGVELTPTQKLLTKDEIIKLVKLFAQNGVDKVRLTGGEPTIRRDLEEIIREIRETNMIKEIGITSNGIVLKRKLKNLVDAGLNRINLSLDTLDENKYMIITRRNGFKKVMEAIEEALPLFDRVKLNCVVTRGVNDMEVVDFVEMTRDKNLDIRFIEYMPFGGNNFNSKKMVSFKEMMIGISKKYDQVIRLKDKPNDTSKAFQVNGFKGQFGFITSMSTPFCSTCNRLRITADGMSSRKYRSQSERLPEGRSFGRGDSGGDWGGSIQKEGRSCRHGGPRQTAKPSNDYNWGLMLDTNKSLFVSTRLYSTIKLSHIDLDGKASMVDVSEKKSTFRTARASGKVVVTTEIMEEIKANRMKKGDVLATARIAGIMGAKKTPDLIPLCHQLNLTNIKIDFDLRENTIVITSECRCKGETGVEMEALTAVSIAALTVYDMCKALGYDILISDIKLISKTGGKSDLNLQI
ncbi:unnamed protein product [Bursaphelenchus xylophilus]|uniref:(pine wood nematode) hypothetical protein n=1 Tax=Bursaphelenchus xylophilus TaxID=6326 RepID=A0A1I7RRQ5_BURXY|nr:unnamed protein product [Bursaphelenchus xylophilus]CAG9123549.1 unnamed protein product [Bursaphelenchus xylophilus]